MGNTPGMSMPRLAMHGMHRRKVRPRRRKALPPKMDKMPSPTASPQIQMNMPGMKMPANPSSSPKQSATPQPSPQQMQMNMPGMQMPAASPSASPQIKMNMTRIQMPAASSN